jgi:hypothetical protein
MNARSEKYVEPDFASLRPIGTETQRVPRLTQMGTTMFRKIAFTIVAAASLSFAALAPASAGHGGGGGGHGGGMHMGGHGGGHGGYFRHGHFWGGRGYFVGSSCYRTVWTNVGPQRVNVCEDNF